METVKNTFFHPNGDQSRVHPGTGSVSIQTLTKPGRHSGDTGALCPPLCICYQVLGVLVMPHQHARDMHVNKQYGSIAKMTHRSSVHFLVALKSQGLDVKVKVKNCFVPSVFPPCPHWLYWVCARCVWTMKVPVFRLYVPRYNIPCAGSLWVGTS